MVTIYTTNSCASCRKAVAWLKDNNIKFKEVNMFKSPLTKNDILKMLENSENGFEDIISTRSKIITESNIDVESMSYNQLVDLIIKNPSILRRPILVDDRRFQVGYDDEEITAFKPRTFKDKFKCENCTNESPCSYIKALSDIK